MLSGSFTKAFLHSGARGKHRKERHRGKGYAINVFSLISIIKINCEHHLPPCFWTSYKELNLDLAFSVKLHYQILIFNSRIVSKCKHVTNSSKQYTSYPQQDVHNSLYNGEIKMRMNSPFGKGCQIEAQLSNILTQYAKYDKFD